MAPVHTDIPSPLGPLRLVANEGGLCGVYFANHRHPPKRIGTESRGEPIFREAAAQLAAYFAGRMTRFDLPLALAGTPFQQEVWTVLRAIPYGERRSYTDLARELGRANAVRAVGAANGRNPISIIVPCHRVLGSNGALTGYAGGMAAKDWLLRHESK